MSSGGRLLLLLWLLLAPAFEAMAGEPPAYYVDQVTNLFGQHHWSRGKEILDEGLDNYPNDPSLHYLAGRYWYNAKNYDLARYHLVKACQIKYDHIDAKTLLINVEDLTENYSSAVCYVNELLEMSPYAKNLWLRKVDLYKKMGNSQEANNQLQRLSVIYPNDAEVMSEYYSVLEASYIQAHRSGNLTQAEENLREMIRINPNDPDYQLAYANVLMLKGHYEAALDVLSSAVNYNPGDIPLIQKMTEVLMMLGRDMGAMQLVKDQLKVNPSPELQELYEETLLATARMENESDPYQLYTRSYEQSPSMEALQYLLGQSVKRGYDDDALQYIQEMRRRTGDQPRWRMLEYQVLRHKGENDRARKLIEAAADQFPDDYDINLTASQIRLEEASGSMQDADWKGAIPRLEFVRSKSVIPEYREIAVRRLFTCYRNSGQRDKAEQMLVERLGFEPAWRVTLDEAELIRNGGDTERALNRLYAAYEMETDAEGRERLKYGFQEMAAPYLRELREKGDRSRVMGLCDTLLELDPKDYWALRTAVSNAEQPRYYIEAGLACYPDDTFFRQQYASSVLLNEGQALRKDHKFDEAAAVLDSALAVSPLDAELRYERGLVYQQQKQWDSAYVYQSVYQPSALEEKEFLARMEALRNRSFQNTADAGFDLLQFTDRDTKTAIATAGYSRSWGGKNALSVRVNYTGRDAEWDGDQALYVSGGGRGFQFLGQYSRDFGSHWSASAGAGFGKKYFPKWTLDASVTRHFGHDWDAEAGIQLRRLVDDEMMYCVSLQGVKTLGHFYFSAKLSSGVLYERVFVNLSGRVRFYPYEGGRLFAEAQAGAGSAPELTFLNYYYSPGSFDHFNSFLALGLRYPLNESFAIGVNGTWNTLYYQRASVNYRNLFIGNVLLTISF